MDRRKFVKGMALIGLTGAYKLSPFKKAMDSDSFFSNFNVDEEQVKLLLTRLDLNKPGLGKVKSLKNNPEQAAAALLTYYRLRHSVKHPVDRQDKDKVQGHYASPKDLRTANNALKHIFVGQPDYPPHFCGKDIDWSTNPTSDNEWVWQLNRMSFWSALAKVYWHTGDEKYARAWCNQLVDWVKKNPRDEQHQYAWRSIEAGIRGYRWMGLYQHFLDAPSFTPEVLVYFLNSCYDHASYLMTKYSKGSNWALMEAEGMGFIAIMFPEFKDSIKWRTEAINRFKQEIDRQVYSDGFQRELSLHYHMGCIRWFLRTFELARMNGLQSAYPDSYMPKIEKMCEVPMKMLLPDGTTAQFGDAWVGEPGEYNDRFRKWAKMFSRSDFLYLATSGKEGTKPDATAYALKKSGYYSMRSGWNRDDICLVLKCGLDGGFHCQPDNGSFVLYAGGRHLTPDSGSYIYSGDPEGRAWFRQTKVHQTLTLNGENSAYKPKNLLWKTGRNLDVLVVENQSYDNLKHRRAVLFVDKKFYVIVDEAMGEALGDVDLHFQLAPGKAIFDRENLSVKTYFADGWNTFIQTNDQKGIQLQKEKGQVSFEYTKKQLRPAFRYRISKENANQAIRFVTVVIPFTGSYEPDVSARIPGNPEVGASHINLEILKDGKTSQVGYEL